MAQGKPTTDPRMVSDADPLEFYDIIEAYAGGAELAEDCRMRDMTAVMFARLAEAAVHQNKSILTNGKVNEYKLRAQRLMEEALNTHGLLFGAQEMLESLPGTPPQLALERMDQIERCREAVKRQSAIHCALIMKDILGFRQRRNIKGRPAKSENDYLSLSDSKMLKEAADAAQAESGRQSVTHDEIAAQIPSIVRNWLRMGSIAPRGSQHDTQESVNTHTRRLRDKLDALPHKTTDYRGFSIKSHGS